MNEFEEADSKNFVETSYLDIHEINFALSYKKVELIGGKLLVDVNKNKRKVYCLSVPCKTFVKNNDDNNNNSLRPLVEHDSSMLILSNDVNLQRVVMEMLQLWKMRIDCTDIGSHALNMLQFNYNYILIDYVPGK